MVDNTWVALVPSQASDPTAWSLGVPVAGQRLIWGAGSSNNCSWDLDALTVTPDGWVLEAGYGGTIAQGAVNVGLGQSGLVQQGGVITGTTSVYWFILNDGDVVHTGGVQTGTTIQYKFYGECSLTTTNTCSAIWATAGARVTKTSANVVARTMQTDADGEIYLAVNTELRYYSSSQFINTGGITGPGSITFSLYDGNKTIDFGLIAGPVIIRAITVATANRILTLTSAAALPSNLTLQSDHATYTLTLKTNSFDVSCTDLTVGTRGVLDADNSSITIAGSFNWVSGNFLGDTSSLYMTGDGTLSGPANSVAYYNLYVGYPGKTIAITTASGVQPGGRLELMGGTVNMSSNFYVHSTAIATGTGLWNQNSNLLLLLGSGSAGGVTVYWPPFDIAGNGSMMLGSDGTGNQILNMTGTPGNYTCSIVTSNAVASYTTTVNMGASVVSAKSFNLNSSTGNAIVNFQTSVVTLTNGLAIGTSKNTADLGTATINGNVSIAGGLLTGAGTINGNVTVSAGTLNHTGDIYINGAVTGTGGSWDGMANVSYHYFVNGNVDWQSGTVKQFKVNLRVIGDRTVHLPNDYTQALYGFEFDGAVQIVQHNFFTRYFKGLSGSLSSPDGCIVEIYYVYNILPADNPVTVSCSIRPRTNSGTWHFNSTNYTFGIVELWPINCGAGDTRYLYFDNPINATWLKFMGFWGYTCQCNYILDADINANISADTGGTAGSNNFINLNGYKIKATTANLSWYSTIIGSGTLELDTINGSNSGGLDLTGGTVRGMALNITTGVCSFGTAEYIKTGAGTEKLGTGQTFYDYRAEVDPLNLASDITITNNYIHARTEVLNGFTLTLLDRTKETWLFRTKKALEGQGIMTAQLRGEYDGTY